MTWLGLEGKVVIVTGAASGIGKSIAEGLLEEGAKVVVCDLNDQKPSYKNESDANILYESCDVTDRKQVREVVENTKAKFGKIDALVNNAGINIPRLLVDEKDPYGKYELSENIFDFVVEVNMKGLYIFAQEVGRELVNQKSGVIVNMSSESGLEGSEGQSIYAATKNAVNSFTRSWSKELGKKGVRVVGIAPGILEETGLRTPAYEEALAYTRSITVDELRKGYESTTTTPLGRAGKLTEVSDLASFLVSDRASYIHGVTINIAEGKTRG